MNAVAPLFPSHEDARSVSLDSIALLLAALREDGESFELMAATYRDPAEQSKLLCAVLANAVCILRTASQQSGIPPERFLAAVAQEVRDAP